MQSLRRFLNPGWVIGLLAVLLFAWLCFAFLAPWQLGKSDDLEARNSRLVESVQADPAPLSEVVRDPDDFVEREWRLVTVSGHWEPDAEGMLRLRSVDGEAVYQILTVFTLDDGREFLVNRGHVPVGENNTAPDYPAAPTGHVEIISRVRATETGQAETVVVDGRQTVRLVDPAVLGEALGHDLVPAGYLQLTADQPGALTPAPIPGIESGPYLSYGLQWLAFGVLAPAALLYFAWSEIRARRRDTAQQEHDSEHSTTDALRCPDSDGAAGEPGDYPDRSAEIDNFGSDASQADEAQSRERAMRARYGQRDDAERRRAMRHADRLRR